MFGLQEKLKNRQQVSCLFPPFGCLSYPCHTLLEEAAKWAFRCDPQAGAGVQGGAGSEVVRPLENVWPRFPSVCLIYQPEGADWAISA